MKKPKIIKNQELFFNLNSQREKKSNLCPLLYNYINKEEIEGFQWIASSKKILEYGTGTGLSLDLFFRNRNQNKYDIYGVDIAGLAIEKAKVKYPKFQFFRIQNNKIPQIRDGYIDATFMFHVLHHSRNHIHIFKEIHSKLKKGGKFLINDLSSHNPIIKLGRYLFVHLPDAIKNKYSHDLVVDGSIPDKYKVDIELVVSQLKRSGFTIQEVGYGHLFCFLFAWIEAFIPLSKSKVILALYKKIIHLEKLLLKYDFFKKRAELFYILCVKT